VAIHSNVYFVLKISRIKKDFYGRKCFRFKPVQEAVAFKNEHGLDLFVYNNAVYEGKIGFKLCGVPFLRTLDEYIKDSGGIKKLEADILIYITKYGLSPRYLYPYKNKDDIFK
jgi:hypothetical protein